MNRVERTRPAAEIRNLIERAIKEGKELLETEPTDGGQLADFRGRYLSWEVKTRTALESSFSTSGFLTTSPQSEFQATAVTLLDLKIGATMIPWDRLSEVISDIKEKIRVLSSIEDRLEIYPESSPATRQRPTNEAAPIFLVHGRNLERREIVRSFLTTVTNRDVVVLADQPNRGQDLLGKLLTHGQEAAFAVVLLTPDDVGQLREGVSSLPRARQNVVFELGMFIGLLGRDRVAALNDPSVELPTDFSGVAYIQVDGESWQLQLARELKAAGISVSIDKAL